MVFFNWEAKEENVNGYVETVEKNRNKILVEKLPNGS